jgi:molecular chaperone GrpE (heat shock protein)/DNA-binding Xre family transcriptional regulator
MSHDYTDRLQALMRSRGFVSYAQLCQASGVTEKVIRRLRRGQIATMQLGTIGKVAQGLGVSTSELLSALTESESAAVSSIASNATPPNVTQPNVTQPNVTQPNALQAEYDRLQQQLDRQSVELQTTFQQAALQTLESWLLQWPTAAYAAQQNPTAPAVKLLPLVRPIENLLREWGVEAIGQVGETVAFDPAIHQPIGNVPNSGDPVQVKYVGYRQGDRLIHRAKVNVN